jgi:hypothetical protein
MVDGEDHVVVKSSACPNTIPILKVKRTVPSEGAERNKSRSGRALSISDLLFPGSSVRLASHALRWQRRSRLAAPLPIHDPNS